MDRTTPVVDYRAHFQELKKNQGTTLGRDLTYREFVKYVQGFDDATNFLDGFHDWLWQRLGGGRSLYWSALVTHDALGVQPAHYSTDLPSDWAQRVSAADHDLVIHLFNLLDLHLAEGQRPA